MNLHVAVDIALRGKGGRGDGGGRCCNVLDSGKISCFSQMTRMELAMHISI